MQCSKCGREIERATAYMASSQGPVHFACAVSNRSFRETTPMVDVDVSQPDKRPTRLRERELRS